MRTPTTPNHRWHRLPLVALTCLLVLAVGFAACGDSPDAVGLDDAISEVEGAADTEADADVDTADAEADTVDPNDTAADAEGDATTAGDAESALMGEWIVQPGPDEFSFDNPTGSFAGFRVDEELSSIGAIEAVGRTPKVSGSLSLEGPDDAITVTAVAIEADMTALVSDDSRRDKKMRGALMTDSFPTATFALTVPVTLPEEASSGQAFSIDAEGELTVAGTTQPATASLEAKLAQGDTGEVVVIVGTIPVTFADFGVTPPSAPIVVSVADSGTVEFQLFFARP